MKPAELDLDSIPKRRSKGVTPSTPTRKHAAWRRIARSLRIDGPQTIYALSKNLVLTQYVVGYIIWYWEKRTFVERVGYRWRLTSKGANLGKPRARSPRQTPKPKPTAWDKISGDD